VRETQLNNEARLARNANTHKHEKMTNILVNNRLPARLTDEEAAQLLGFQKHDIPVLIKRRLLAPLGRPATNAHKYFSTVQVEECSADSKWLGEATQAVYKYWSDKNARRAAALN
jgi:hypothetical protein